MNRLILALAFFSFVLCTFNSQQIYAASVPEPKTFTAERRAIRLNGQLPPSKEETVTVKAKAIVYNPPLVIPDFTQYKEPLDQAVQFIVNYHKTLVNSGPDDISVMWHSGERNGKKELLEREGVLAAMKKHYQSNKRLEIYGIVYQENTESVPMKLGEYVVSFNIVKENGELKLTDNPDDDLEIAIIEASFL